MARFGKLLVVAMVTVLGFAGSALYGSASHLATLQDLVRATGGACYAVYWDTNICSTSKTICVSDGDGTSARTLAAAAPLAFLLLTGCQRGPVELEAAPAFSAKLPELPGE